MERIPHDVEAMFNGIAEGLIEQGWEKFSARTILHRIRWYYRVDKRQRTFKVNNNWSSKLSRSFTEKHPKHVGFFEQRRARALGE